MTSQRKQIRVRVGCGAAGGGQLLQQVRTQVAPFFATLRLPLQAGIGMVCQQKFMFYD